ncbi:hypothetical protein HDV06_004558 [Boothiomyces sp. JEL0866]|nr:hypothetical protein HDV06_004558 [Boothiomyces sp. JEL0866]
MKNYHGIFTTDQLELLQKNNSYTQLDYLKLSIELDLCQNNTLFTQTEIIKRFMNRNTDVELEVKNWNDIGGYAEVKQQLERNIVWKFKNIKNFERIGITPPKGCIMYGPPGNGKTLLAKCLAGEAGVNFIAVSISSIIKGEVGETEKAIQRLFKDAKENAPSVIFFDEVDALFTDRAQDDLSAKLYSQLVGEIDDLNSEDSVSVLSATNHLELIDSALLRPGRIDCLIFVDFPNEKDRREILEKLLGQQKVDFTDIQLSRMVAENVGASCADLFEVARRFAL